MNFSGESIVKGKVRTEEWMLKLLDWQWCWLTIEEFVVKVFDGGMGVEGVRRRHVW